MERLSVVCFRAADEAAAAANPAEWNWEMPEKRNPRASGIPPKTLPAGEISRKIRLGAFPAPGFLL